MALFPKTERTRLKRIPERGVYEPDEVYRILDEGLVAHVGFVVNGQPYVIPMAYGRRGDELLIHGSSASRLLRSVGSGIRACVTVTLLDGVVAARAVFHHSMNYRSAIVFGVASAIDERGRKLAALEAISDHILPGRWNEARRPNAKELAATLVLSLPLEEASAKIRRGPPKDEEEDGDLPIWAGEIPLRLVPLDPVPDPALRPPVDISRSVQLFRKSRDSKGIG